MNIDDECRAAMSRVSYAANANAEWQKKLIAKEFAKLRANYEPDIFSPLRELHRLQQAAMNKQSNSLLGLIGMNQANHYQQQSSWDALGYGRGTQW
jgi:hypothetical protein